VQKPRNGAHGCQWPALQKERKGKFAVAAANQPRSHKHREKRKRKITKKARKSYYFSDLRKNQSNPIIYISTVDIERI
jgi:hypothetical protein